MKRVLIEAYLSDYKIAPMKGDLYVSGLLIPIVSEASFDFETEKHHVIRGPAMRVIYVEGQAVEMPMFKMEKVEPEPEIQGWDTW